MNTVQYTCTVQCTVELYCRAAVLHSTQYSYTVYSTSYTVLDVYSKPYCTPVPSVYRRYWVIVRPYENCTVLVLYL